MSKAARQRSAREKLAEERRRHEQRRRRNRALITGVGALVMVGVLVIAVVVAQSDEDVPKGYRGGVAPTTRQADSSIVMAKPGTVAPVLEIFDDFQCPSCKAMEDTSGSTIKKLAFDGQAKVIYRPFQLFAQSSEPTRSNSWRALNASFCAPADRWVQYHDALYKNQPDEQKKGFENQRLIDWAGDVGITGSAFERCVNGGQKSAQIQQATTYATRTRAVDGTPKLFLNGKALSNDVAFNPDALRSAVLAAPATPAATSSSAAAGRRPRAGQQAG